MVITALLSVSHGIPVAVDLVVGVGAGASQGGLGRLARAVSVYRGVGLYADFGLYAGCGLYTDSGVAAALEYALGVKPVMYTVLVALELAGAYVYCGLCAS